MTPASNTPRGPDLTKFPCLRCGVPCYRICYIAMSLVCSKCFEQIARATA